MKIDWVSIIAIIIITIPVLIFTVYIIVMSHKKLKVLKKLEEKCDHEWELMGGGGERDSGFVYKCKKCGTIGLTD